jgi:hypothetical protein
MLRLKPSTWSWTLQKPALVLYVTRFDGKLIAQKNLIRFSQLLDLLTFNFGFPF